jgi:PST family polysaccharide transporter
VDVFIIGHAFNSYYLGLYNNSLNIVNAIMNIITSSVSPVLLSGLSRYQNNEKEYNNLLFNTQKIMAYLILPMGAGIFLYQDLATTIALGEKWAEAAGIIGVTSLLIPPTILLSNITSVCYISKGKPKLHLIAQLLYLIPLVVLGIYLSNKGFWEYVYGRNIFKIELIVINLIILNFVLKISAIQMLKNLVRPLIATLIMSAIAILLKMVSNSILWSILSICICVVIYFGVVWIIDKKIIIEIKNKIFKRRIVKSEQ